MFNIKIMDVKNIDISLLRTFSALIHESSVTKAALRLGLSQPATSTALRRIRETFSDPILTRTVGGSAPTPRALELIEAIDEILDRVDRLTEENSFDPSTLKARISITASDYARQIVLPKIMRHLSAAAPGLHLDFQLTDRGRVRGWMERGEVDLGIGPAEVPTGRLHFRALCNDEAVVIHARRVRWGPEPMTPERFCQFAHVRITPHKPFTSAASFYDEALDRELDKLRLERFISLTLPDFLSVIPVVSGSDLVATVPRRLIAAFKNSTSLVLEAPPVALSSVVVGMYWHERTHRSPLHMWLRKQIRATLNDL